MRLLRAASIFVKVCSDASAYGERRQLMQQGVSGALESEEKTVGNQKETITAGI